MSEESVAALEPALGYRFANRGLLTRALTHRSWSSDQSPPEDRPFDNEQLEFLGDSILGFVVSEALVARNPFAQEGLLSQWKAQLVSSTHLYGCALTLHLGRFLILGKGEERNGGRERKALLANAMEAIIAAIHLDGGIDSARSFVHQHVLGPEAIPHSTVSPDLTNHKSALQEQLQALGLAPPRYAIVETSGPEHAKLFTVEVSVGDRFIGRATGSSKKTASQHAAQEVMKQLAEAGGELALLHQNAKPAS